jgi:hypothetical protein
MLSCSTQRNVAGMQLNIADGNIVGPLFITEESVVIYFLFYRLQLVDAGEPLR